jgi:hypothetical protein
MLLAGIEAIEKKEPSVLFISHYFNKSLTQYAHVQSSYAHWGLAIYHMG